MNVWSKFWLYCNRETLENKAGAQKAANAITDGDPVWNLYSEVINILALYMIEYRLKLTSQIATFVEGYSQICMSSAESISQRQTLLCFFIILRKKAHDLRQ